LGSTLPDLDHFVSAEGPVDHAPKLLLDFDGALLGHLHQFTLAHSFRIRTLGGGCARGRLGNKAANRASHVQEATLLKFAGVDFVGRRTVRALALEILAVQGGRHGDSPGALRFHAYLTSVALGHCFWNSV
jgi:hypothetical protein